MLHNSVTPCVPLKDTQYVFIARFERLPFRSYLIHRAPLLTIYKVDSPIDWVVVVGFLA